MDSVVSYTLSTQSSQELNFGYVSKILQHPDHTISLIIVPVEASVQYIDDVIGSIAPYVLKMKPPRYELFIYYACLCIYIHIILYCITVCINLIHFRWNQQEGICLADCRSLHKCIEVNFRTNASAELYFCPFVNVNEVF